MHVYLLAGQSHASVLMVDETAVTCNLEWQASIENRRQTDLSCILQSKSVFIVAQEVPCSLDSSQNCFNTPTNLKMELIHPLREGAVNGPTI